MGQGSEPEVTHLRLNQPPVFFQCAALNSLATQICLKIYFQNQQNQGACIHAMTMILFTTHNYFLHPHFSSLSVGTRLYYFSCK